MTLLAAVLSGVAWGQDIQYLRVGAGPPGESHFPLGGLIAGAISNPPGSRPCERGGSCGVPGVIAVATATNGSAFNAEAMGQGRLELALIQADVGMWATRGEPPFAKPVAGLRAIARLYPDQLHLVVRQDAHIASPRDLRGKRVAMGVAGSGAQAHARQVLAAWGVKESDLKVDFLRSALAADAMAAGKLDAFFVVDGSPVPSVEELAKYVPIALVPLAGDGARKLIQGDPLLAVDVIPAGTYQGQTTDVPTLAVAMDLVVAATLPDDLVYGITRALWHASTTRLLADNQPRGVLVKLGDALTGVGLPLHPGAARFYRENGMLE